MKATKVIALTLAILLVIAVAALAAQANRPAGQGHGPMLASLVKILMPPRPEQLAKAGIGMNVTDQQKLAIKALYQTFNGALKAVGPARADALKGVLTLIQQPSPNKADLQAGGLKVLDGDKAILDAEYDFWIGLKGILGAQGGSTVDSYMRNRAMGEMSGGGMHAGPPGGGPGGPPPPHQ